MPSLEVTGQGPRPEPRDESLWEHRDREPRQRTIQRGSPEHNLLEEAKVVRSRESHRYWFREAGKETQDSPIGREGRKSGVGKVSQDRAAISKEGSDQLGKDKNPSPVRSTEARSIRLRTKLVPRDPDQ